MKYLAMLSGGQDSTAMTLRMLELGMQIDYIIFCDTGLEVKEMYNYIDKLDTFFQRKYNIKITRLNPRKTFEEWVFGKVTSGEMEGKIRGIPLITTPCYWRREVKEYAFLDFIKENNITEYIKYIGYTFRESDRWKDIEKYNAVAPFVEWKWNEPEVQKYLKDNQMENKLYQHFTRIGCGICPKQGKSFYEVYKYYPDTWKYAKDLEKRLYNERDILGEKQMPSYDISRFSWELEEDFKRKDKQQTFDLGFAPPQDCFCKI